MGRIWRREKRLRTFSDVRGARRARSRARGRERPVGQCFTSRLSAAVECCPRATAAKARPKTTIYNNLLRIPDDVNRDSAAM